MTITDFRDCVKKEFAAYKSKLIEKSGEELFACAHDIAKMDSIYLYLMNTDNNSLITELIPHANNILSKLYEYEKNYDKAMWGTWEEIERVVNDFLEENEDGRDIVLSDDTRLMLAHIGELKQKNEALKGELDRLRISVKLLAMGKVHPCDLCEFYKDGKCGTHYCENYSKWSMSSRKR